jgi:hypothetical protein
MCKSPVELQDEVAGLTTERAVVALCQASGRPRACDSRLWGSAATRYGVKPLVDMGELVGKQPSHVVQVDPPAGAPSATEEELAQLLAGAPPEHQGVFEG